MKRAVVMLGPALNEPFADETNVVAAVPTNAPPLSPPAISTELVRNTPGTGVAVRFSSVEASTAAVGVANSGSKISDADRMANDGESEARR